MSQGKPSDQCGDALKLTTVRGGAALDRNARLLSIIVPLYNEEQNVDPLCTQLLALAEKVPERVEIILVDDGSRDGTPAAVARWVSQDARIKSIRFRRNFGQTAAMSAGFAAAYCPATARSATASCCAASARAEATMRSASASACA